MSNIHLALDHHRAGRLAEAEEIYKGILLNEPRQPDALHLLGLIAYHAGNFNLACSLIARAISSNPKSSAYHTSHGNALFAAEQPTAAIAAYQHAISLDPTANKPYKDLADTLRITNLTDQAIDVFIGAISRAGGIENSSDPRIESAAIPPTSMPSSTAQFSTQEEDRGTFYRTVQSLMEDLARHSSRGDADGALRKVEKFVRACVFDRRSHAKVFACSELDSFCQAVGRSLMADMGQVDPISDAYRADCVVLATELYRLGGHTAVIEDLVRTGVLGERVVVILTDAFNTADASVIADRFPPSVVTGTAPKGGPADKLRWTVHRLKTLRPRRLILMNHHNDPVAIAAAQPTLADETIFFHHADTQLCLGVTLEHTLHVDPHPMGFKNCRDNLGVRHSANWPLVAIDQGMRPKSGFFADGKIRTCSSGSSNKFEYDYIYKYADILPSVMAATGGVHVHIGPLSDATLTRIRSQILTLGIPPQRFVHVPWVRSLWKALHAFQIDVVLASFPMGGGKALIEAMGAGVPVIRHECYISPLYGAGDMFYPGAFQWTEPLQLVDRVRALTIADIARESLEARRHFERYHTIAALSRAIQAGRDVAERPTLSRITANPLQLFLDDVHFGPQDIATHLRLR